MLDAVQRVDERPGAAVLELQEMPVGPFDCPASQQVANDAFVAVRNLCISVHPARMSDVRLIVQATERREMTWEPELEELRQRQALAREMGGPDKIARQRAAGRLTVRERIGTLLDAGSFQEIGSITGNGAYDETGALQSMTPTNFLFGRGRIEGRRVVVAGDDFTVRGGASDASIIEKQVHAEQMAHELRLPMSA